MVRRKHSVLLLLGIYCLTELSAQNDSVFNGNTISSFKLYNTNQDKSIFLTEQNIGKPFSLFIFLSPECPLCQNYLSLFNSLQEKYKTEIAFYGIVPGRAYPATVIKEFASTYQVRFPLLIDSLKSLTRYLHATITPQVILLDNKNTLVYKGAVDDLLMGLGKRRVKVINEYLKNAIIQSLDNKMVTVKRTKAVGCKINDY
jgi:thiol-disulfide isomerase/thioredoxin